MNNDLLLAPKRKTEAISETRTITLILIVQKGLKYLAECSNTKITNRVLNIAKFTKWEEAHMAIFF